MKTLDELLVEVYEQIHLNSRNQVYNALPLGGMTRADMVRPLTEWLYDHEIDEEDESVFDQFLSLERDLLVKFMLDTMPEEQYREVKAFLGHGYANGVDLAECRDFILSKYDFRIYEDMAKCDDWEYGEAFGSVIRNPEKHCPHEMSYYRAAQIRNFPRP